MSWSVSLIGIPANISRRLMEIGEKMEGQSKREFMDAMPHLCSLVEQNFDHRPENKTQVIELTANGSGFGSDTEQINRSCNVTIKNNYTELV